MPTFTVVRETPAVLPVKEVVIILSIDEIKEILASYSGIGYQPKAAAFIAIYNKLKHL